MIILLHRANMEILFIIEPYACLMYCIDYISKSENRMSKLLREALNKPKRTITQSKSILKSLQISF